MKRIPNCFRKRCMQAISLLGDVKYFTLWRCQKRNNKYFLFYRNQQRQLNCSALIYFPYKHFNTILIQQLCILFRTKDKFIIFLTASTGSTKVGYNCYYWNLLCMQVKRHARVRPCIGLCLHVRTCVRVNRSWSIHILKVLSVLKHFF